MATTLDPATLVEPWGAVPRTVDLGGPTHFVVWDGPAEPTPIVLVHGLGGSHLNWMPLGQLLAKSRRVYALDLAGFGLTHPAGRGTAVADNAQLVGDFIATVVGRPAYLVGNSMGGLITTMVARSRPELVRGAVLLNPALPITTIRHSDAKTAAMFLAFMTPRLGERTMRRMTKGVSPHRQVEQTMSMVMERPQLEGQLFEASVDLAAHRRGLTHSDDSFLTAARSIIGRGIRPSAAHRHMSAIQSPVLLIHGDKDRVVPVSAARRAAAAFPHWKYVELEGIGHVPMIECTERTAELIERFIEDNRTRPNDKRTGVEPNKKDTNS